MFTKTITYKDYNGGSRTETYNFNLTTAEITEMQLGTSGGLAEMLTKIVNANDTPSLIKIFKDLILKSYGVKSPDGRRFEKSEELSAAFSQTPAYSDLFMELATNDEAAWEFIKGTVPAEIAAHLDAEKSAMITPMPVPSIPD